MNISGLNIIILYAKQKQPGCIKSQSEATVVISDQKL